MNIPSAASDCALSDGASVHSLTRGASLGFQALPTVVKIKGGGGSLRDDVSLLSRKRCSLSETCTTIPDIKPCLRS